MKRTGKGRKYNKNGRKNKLNSVRGWEVGVFKGKNRFTPISGKTRSPTEKTLTAK